jgi:hypothetical protein
MPTGRRLHQNAYPVPPHGSRTGLQRYHVTWFAQSTVESQMDTGMIHNKTAPIGDW